MADVFFTCHVHGITEPLYISETVFQTMNPTFRNIDFSQCTASATRTNTIILRFWVKTAKMSSWRLLLQTPVDLQNLQYLGKSLDRCHSLLPQNAIIINLTDGIYTPSITNLPEPQPHILSTLRTEKSGRRLLTSSFDALLRLLKLDESINDALVTRDRIAADLEQLIHVNQPTFMRGDGVARAEDRLKTLEYAKTTVEKQLEKARKQHAEKRASIQARRSLIWDDRNRREIEEQQMRLARPKVYENREERAIKQRAIHNQRRRICEDLQKCYPIQPVPTESLAFTVRGLFLPNTDNLDGGKPEEVAAALGHVAHVVLLLSFYFRRPVPYPVRPCGSTSTIEDPISLLKTIHSSSTSSNADNTALRIYPLFTKGAPRFRFDYALFLLNKNIQILLETVFNIRVLDLRHTLPNLKYLFYAATAGVGELPARKAGGVRGLIRARSSDRDISADDQKSARRDSNESTGFVKPPARSKLTANARVRIGAVESLKKNFAGVT